MTFPSSWEILIISLWIQVGFLPWIHCKDGTVHLSREDLLVFKDEQNPKCFTRTQWDGICFFETADNRIYDLFYSVDEWDMCQMSVQETEEGTFLHICSFPIFVYVETNLKVIEHDTNATLYTRTVYMEELILLNPPFSVSLHQTGIAGQLKVSWQSNILHFHKDSVIYRIRYSSKALGEKTKEAKQGDILDSLAPGEEVEVQVQSKVSDARFWSSWSHPVRAVVPHSAETVLLLVLVLILVLMLITAIFLISLFHTPLRKLKLYIWPPVPNLDKVLQGYVTEINGQNWNPTLITKHCFEETVPSLVEIMSDKEVSGSGKPSEESAQLLSPEGSFSCREQVDGSAGTVFPDYVTLNKDSVILCPKGNKYVVEYETSVDEKETPAVESELFQTCNSSCSDGSVCTKPCCTDFLNHSYLFLAEPSDKVYCKVIATSVPGNLYTNLPCS